MLPTPSTSHLDFTAIYEPSEDSFLLLDTLSAVAERDYLQRRLSTGSTLLALEVGSGSGVVLAFLAANSTAICGRSDVATLGIDVSFAACRGTASTVNCNVKSNVFLDSVQSDLASAIKPGTVDLLIFNPPYVPSEHVPKWSTSEYSPASFSGHDKFQHDSNLLALATDGGEDGMEVTNRLLAQIPSTLSKRGVAYVLLCAQNKPERVKDGIRAWDGSWEVETVRTSGKQGGWEKLQIVRIARRLLERHSVPMPLFSLE